MPRFHKYKLLLDEGFPIRTYFPRLNSIYDLRHITKDLNASGLKDLDVFAHAAKLKRLLVTYNYKDFRELLVDNKDTGVIGVSATLPTDQIDKKLVALLSRSSPGELYGKSRYISGESS